jgi:hypothetical protein
MIESRRKRVGWASQAVFAAFLIGGLAWAEEKTGESKPAGGIYVPPPRGAAGSRVGAATRGTADLFALAPDHVGLTTSAAPVLYWFTAAEARAAIVIEISRVGSDAVLLRVEQAPPIPAGFHRLALADHGIELEPGAVYEWKIVWPKKGLECLAAIMRTQADDSLTGALARAPDRAWEVYAKNGYWYDAVSDLNGRIERAPADASLAAARAALVAQAGLSGPPR